MELGDALRRERLAEAAAAAAADGGGDGGRGVGIVPVSISGPSFLPPPFTSFDSSARLRSIKGSIEVSSIKYCDRVATFRLVGSVNDAEIVCGGGDDATTTTTTTPMRKEGRERRKDDEERNRKLRIESQYNNER